MLDEHVELLEGAGIEQHLDPLARGELALGVLRLDPSRATAGLGFRATLGETVQDCPRHGCSFGDPAP